MSSRLNIKLCDDDRARIERTRGRIGAASETEVIRRAVRLLDLASEHQAKGGRLVLRRNGAEDEVVRLVF